MNDFLTYFNLGFKHITDLGGYDHILFIAALCAVYLISDWKQLLIIVTFFTIGHSITLALAVVKLVNIDSKIIEFLIPVTILFTALSNLFQNLPENSQKKFPTPISRYILTGFFGLIHGLGFSNYLKSLLGVESDIFIPLLSFNIGLEIGQLIIVLIIMLLSFIFYNLFNFKRKDINLVTSGFVAGVTMTLLIDKWIF